MAHETHWRTTARSVIDQALREGRAEGLEGKALLARVDAAYPFGERSMWPYKIWLEQRRKQCWSLLPERTRKGRRPIDDHLDQLEAEMRQVAEANRR